MKRKLISDTDYIKILLRFFHNVSLVWSRKWKTKKKNLYVRLHGTLVRSFNRFSFYMYYKMAKRRERRIWHMVFRWINVWCLLATLRKILLFNIHMYYTCIRWRRIKIDISWCRNWYSVWFKKWNNLKHVLLYLKLKIGGGNNLDR